MRKPIRARGRCGCSRRRAASPKESSRCSPGRSASSRAGGTAPRRGATTSSRAPAKRSLAWIYRERGAEPGGLVPAWHLRLSCFLPTPSCTASPTSRFLRGASHRGGTGRARGRARLLGARASPTNARSPASCARTSRAKQHGLQADHRHRAPLDDGLEARAARAGPQGLRRALVADHHGTQAAAERARIALRGRPRSASADGLLALLVPGEQPSRKTRSGSGHASRAAAGSRWNCIAARTTWRSCGSCERRCETLRPAARRRGRRAHARALAPAPAGHADRDPPGHAGRRVRRRAVPQRRAPPALARAARAALPAGAARARRSAIAERCAFSLDELRYEYPRGARARRARRRPRTCASSTDAGTGAGAFRHGAPARTSASMVEHELDADRGAALRALLPHRARHRALRALRGHPVPGPRLGGQLRGLLLPRASPRSTRRAWQHAVRALHLARSATSRPTSTSISSTSGARRSSSTSTESTAATAPRIAATVITYRRGARVRDVGKALGPRARAGRPAREVARRGGTSRATCATRLREAGLRSGQARSCASVLALAGELIGFPAPPVAARRRLRDLARAAVAAGAGRERRDGRAHASSSGTRTTSTRSACSRSTCSRSACCRRSAARSTSCPRSAVSARDAGHSRRGSGGLRHDPARPTPSACSRSNRARRCRCCRA